MFFSLFSQLESLDAYICLRTNGFFPHDVRCDHFYECRNSTIINEGICKQGLRFDYRYRKKPRCIASDQIDCRITQVVETVSSNVYNANGNDNRHSSTTASSAPAENVTIASTSSPKMNSTTAAPSLFDVTTLVSADKSESSAFEATTTTRPPNRNKVTRKKTTTATISKPKSHRTTLPPPTTTTTTTITTTLSPTTKAFVRKDDNKHDRHHRVHHHHHHEDDHPHEKPVHETNRLDSAPGDDDDTNMEFDLPARRRKVARKSVKLRRGRLQEQPVLGAGDTSLAGQHLRAAQLLHQPHSLMSRE